MTRSASANRRRRRLREVLLPPITVKCVVCGLIGSYAVPVGTGNPVSRAFRSHRRLCEKHGHTPILAEVDE